MKIFTNILFVSTLVIHSQIQAQTEKQQEAHNAEEVSYLQNRLSESRHQGLYVNLEAGQFIFPSHLNPQINFTVGNNIAGNIPAKYQRDLNQFGVGMGLRKVLTDKVGIRYQGGYKWMRLSFNDSVDYSSMEFAPVASTLDGSLNTEGPHGGVFFDFQLGDFDDFFYVGSSVGYVKARNKYAFSGAYDATLDATDWTRMYSLEAGFIFRMGKRSGLRMAYELSRLNALDYTTSRGSNLAFNLSNTHTFKMGFVHFFRKR